MVKKFNSMLLAIVMLLGLCVLSPLSAAAETTTSTASAYDVYISGNYMVGETLTAHYTYYDPMGLPEVKENVQYQWYKMTRKGVLTSLGTDVTYTITADDKGTTAANELFIFVKVTTANENGLGEGVYSELLIGSTWDYSNKKPTVLNAYIAPQNPTGSMKIGDTLVARFAYQNSTEVTDTEAYPNNKYVPEGDFTYEWKRKDTVTGEATVVQGKGPNNNTYTLTSADLGKVIECVITPIDADGNEGSSYTAKNHYGNLFYGNNATVTDATSTKFNAVAADMPAIGIIRDIGGFQLYSSSKNLNYDLVVDVGGVQSFDGIFLNISAGSEVTVSYSVDNVNWTPVTGTITKGVDCELKLDNPAIARYFKVSVKFSSSNGLAVYAFYPFATKEDSPKLINDETGAVVSELEDGATYTLQYRLDKGFGDNSNDYLAVYELLYDGGELKSTSMLNCVTSEHDDFAKLSITVPCELTGVVDVATGYTKKYIVKSFSFSDTLVPNMDARVWE